jgi:archaellum component FlaC
VSDLSVSMERNDGEASMVYDDIENIGQDLEIQRLTKENEDLKKQVDSLSSEVQELRSQIVHVVSQRDTIEKNLMVVYNTALKEIARKDRELFALTSELDAYRAKKA